MVEDGRRFLRKDQRRWDLIVVDAFYADGVPFHLATLEFVELAPLAARARRRRRDQRARGAKGDESRRSARVAKTYGGVFPTVRLHPRLRGPTDRVPEYARNVILIATERAAPGLRQLGASWAEVAPFVLHGARARRRDPDRWSGALETDDVPYLTDGYAPTDALLVD